MQITAEKGDNKLSEYRFYDEVARIRVDEDYADEEVRRNHARVTVERLTAAINDPL